LRNCRVELGHIPTRAHWRALVTRPRIVAWNPGRVRWTARPKRLARIGRRIRRRRRARASRPWNTVMNRRDPVRPRSPRQFKRRHLATEVVRFATIQRHLRRRQAARAFGKAKASPASQGRGGNRQRVRNGLRPPGHRAILNPSNVRSIPPMSVTSLLSDWRQPRRGDWLSLWPTPSASAFRGQGTRGT
jgi:hypothetical protein